jgi:hypothetical protein
MSKIVYTYLPCVHIHTCISNSQMEFQRPPVMFANSHQSIEILLTAVNFGNYVLRPNCYY